MKPRSLFSPLLLHLLAFNDLSHAYPGMPSLESLIQHARQAPDSPPELLGDLLTLPDAKLTPTATAIKSMLLGRAPAHDDSAAYASSAALPGKDTPQCRADTCCIWKYVVDDMVAKFRGSSGRCTKLARSAIRLGFHDAGTWSKSKPRSGADGSVILSGEISRPDHAGLQEVAGAMKGWYDKWKKYGVGAADLVQMGATVAAVVCPLGPRVRSFVGRKDNSAPSPEGQLPDVLDPPGKLVALFADKTISPLGLVALVGAHTIAQQRIVDKNRAGDPQDTTPGVWDTNFYGETKSNTPRGVLKFASDQGLANFPDTQRHWDSFIGQKGQAPWNIAYAREYLRVSMLGVSNINNLTECTKVLPQPVTSFRAADQGIVQKWLEGKLEYKLGQTIVKILEDGGLISGIASRSLKTAGLRFRSAVADLLGG